MQNCGLSLIKYLMFVFNLIFFITGIGIIAAGSISLANKNVDNLIKEDTTAASIVLIVVGIIVFGIAFFGCYGAVKESYCMLVTFAVFLIGIIAIEMIIGITICVLRNDFGEAMKDALRASIKNYTASDQTSWDDVQQQWKCCGIDGPQDWTAEKGFGGNFPNSCCDVETCNYGDPSVYNDGCYEKIKWNAKKYMALLVGLGVGIAFVEVSGIVLACILGCSIKKEQQDK